jgi:hypothetical protein
VNRRQFNTKAADQCKLTQEMVDYLVNPRTVERMAGLTLRQRAHDLFLTYNVQVDPSTILRQYQKHGVTMRKVSYKQKAATQPGKLRERRFFAITLARLLQNKRNLIVYVYETSLNSWLRTSHTYRGTSDYTAVVIPDKRIGKRTVIGAIGDCVANYFTYSIVNKTT